MKLLEYLGITEDELQIKYIATGLIDLAFHDEFPLEMLTYGREAVHENVWDDVTTKCRGLIVNMETGEIIARPFEKFFNLGDTSYYNQDAHDFEAAWGQPEVHEKMDGFLCTMYEWEGKQYLASKGSFHSMHAKWATAWYHQHTPNDYPNVGYAWAKGYTPVFEGITPSIRIVVDYGGREELVLLALVNKETGEELPHEELAYFAKINNIHLPAHYTMSWQQASVKSLDATKNFEGYVLVWPRPGQTPFRLKVKYLDYLRIHRMVTGTSPKAIFQVLSQGWDSEMDTWLDDSVPWFNAYVSKWKNALETRYKEIAIRVDEVFTATRKTLQVPPFGNEFPVRKDWAAEFTKPENKEISGALFGMLDGKDVRQIIWKLVKPMTLNAKPLVDARFV
jgi:RNA ligase